MPYYTRIKKRFRPGQVIISENSECDGMYIIESGRVRVYTKAASEKGHVEIDLCTLGPNSMFGEMAMIDNGKRAASVMAIDPTICTIITKKMFEHQLERIPSWMVNMIRILVIRLRETNERLREIIEKYSVPPADGGSIITIGGEPSSRPFGSTADEEMFQPPPIVKQYREDILKEIRERTSSSQGTSPKI
jgi:CRP-like cAMP-binding protein